MLSTAAIGIDISEQQVRIVCLKKPFKSIHLLAAEKCLLAEDKAFKDRIGDITDFINDFVKAKRISSADIHIGIPTGQVIFRELELPLAVKENLAATLSYEMEKYVPLAAAAVYFDYQVVAEDRERNVITVSLAVAKRADLDPYLEVAAGLDLSVSGLSPACGGIVNSFLLHSQGNEALKLVAFSDDTRMEVQVIRGRRLVYAKTLAPSPGSGRDQGDDTGQIKALMQRFAASDAPAPLWLHSREPAPEVSRQMEQIGAGVFQGTLAPSPELPADEFVPAYGLALQAFETAAVNINFMPVGMRKKPNKTPFYLMCALAGGLVLTGLLWAGIFLARQHAWLDHLDQKLVELRAEAAETEEMRGERDKLQSRIERLESLRPGNAYVVNVLLELTRRIPETAWVKDLNLSGNDVRLYGMAESASDLIPALEEAPLLYDAEFLSTIRRTGDGRDVFRIGLKFKHDN